MLLLELMAGSYLGEDTPTAWGYCCPDAAPACLAPGIMLSYSSMSATAAGLCLFHSMMLPFVMVMLPFGMVMLGAGATE